MDDLARLLVGERIGVAALECRERPQGGPRHVGPHLQQLERGDQRIPPEQRVEATGVSGVHRQRARIAPPIWCEQAVEIPDRLDRLALYGAGGEAGHDPLLEDQDRDHQRDGDHHEGGGDRPERHLELLAAREERERRRHGPGSGELVSVIANRNWFQDSMNASRPAVTKPGAASGRTTLQKAWKCVAPSMSAASSSSRGISLKNDARM